MIISPPIPVVAGVAPKEGTRAARINLQFPGDNGATIDLSQLQLQGELMQCQTLFIDNSANDATLVLTSAILLQAISIPAGAQGYIPVLAPNPPKFSVACVSASKSARVFALNYSVPPALWGVSGGGSGTPVNNYATQVCTINVVSMTNHTIQAANNFKNIGSVSIFLYNFTSGGTVFLNIGFGAGTSVPAGIQFFIPQMATAFNGLFWSNDALLFPNLFGVNANLNYNTSIGPISSGYICLAIGVN